MRVLNWFCVPQINDIMRKEDRSWNIRSLNTTFLIFMKKLEDEVNEEASFVQFSPRDLHFSKACTVPCHLITWPCARRATLIWRRGAALPWWLDQLGTG